ncbi:MAG: PAS domain-containing protein [Chloroflexi bacterium]|nr:PAS domain-containing protein [Chloroflexota bacterium]
MVKRGGSEFHAALAALPAQDADGAAGMRLTLSDVTERKQAGESLQKSEEEYRRLFEDSPIALWVEDFSEVKRRLDGLKQTGVRDAAAYFRANPGFVRECAALVRIQDVNSAALKLYHAREKSELLGSLADILATLSHEQF